MPLDPSIPLQSNVPPDPLTQAAKIYTIKAAMQQSQMGDYELQDQLTLRDAAGLPGVKNPDGTMNISALLSNVSGKVSPKAMMVLSDAAQKQESYKQAQQKHKQEQAAAFMKASADPMASIYTEYKQNSAKVGPDKAWEMSQPKTEQLRQELSQMFPDMKMNEGMKSPDQLEAAARHSSEYLKNQQRATQPETPHESRTRDETERHNREVEASAKRKEGDAETGLKTEDYKFMAGQYLAGDKSVMQNLGRGAQGARDIRMLRKTIRTEAAAQGMTPVHVAIKMAEFEGLKAGERTAGTREAQLGFAAHELEQFIPLARNAIEKVPRTEFRPINKLIELAQTQKLSPNQAALVAANRSVINAFSMVASRGAQTVHNVEEAEKMLSTAQDQPTYNAVLDQLDREVKGALKAPQQVKEDLRRGMTGETPKAEEKKRKVWTGSGFEMR